jgi:uncharacterized delta-60 repeat protein
LVAAGEIEPALPALQGSLIVVRRLADGSLDPSFALAGEYLMLLPGHSATVSGLAVLANGGVLVEGSLENVGPGTSLTAFVLELSPAGKPVSSFGRGGIVRLAATNGAQGNGLALATRGRILVAVQASGGTEIERLLPNGNVDRSFGKAGVVQTAVRRPGFTARLAGPMLALANGGLVLGGTVTPRGATPGRAALARLTPTGAFDQRFGARGIDVLPDARLLNITALAAAPGSRLIVLAANNLARVAPNGRLDPRFGDPGIARIDVSASGFTAATAIALAADGSILIAGDAVIPVEPDFLGNPLLQQVTPPPAPPPDLGRILARLTPSGAFDCSFGPFGRGLLLPLGSAGNPSVASIISTFGLVLDNQGRALLAGYNASLGGADTQFTARALGGHVPVMRAAPLAYTDAIAPTFTPTNSFGGWINPRCADTNWQIQWGATTAYGNTTPSRLQSAAAGPAHVTTQIPNLPAGTYHYRILATNPLGTTTGGDAAFRVN